MRKLVLAVICLIGLLSLRFLPALGDTPTTQGEKRGADETDPSHTILAVVMPDGREVHVVEGGDYKERALKKAGDKLQAVKKAGKSVDGVEPKVFTYKSSEDLFKAVGLRGDGHIADQSILYNRKKCGRLVPGSDHGCVGTVHTVYNDYHVCTAGGKYDDCWDTDQVVGTTVTYATTQACKDGNVAGASVQQIRERACDRIP